MAVTLLCAALPLVGAPRLVGQAAGLLLVFLLPGLALLLALPADLRPRAAAERLALTVGFSVALSMLCMWLASQVAGLGIISRWLAVETALVTALGLLALRRPARVAILTTDGTRRVPGSRHTMLFVAITLLAASSLRFPSLGYGELYDDELDVAQSARSLLLGQTSVVFEHRKGPTEIWLAAATAGTSMQLDEATLRLPFVLASLGAIVVTVLLGEEFLGTGRGLLAGLLLSGEGIFLAFSRMVQYQGFVQLMIALVAWCALRFWRVPARRAEIFYLAAGALFWSFGTLTHWDGALSGLLLAYAVWLKWGSAWRSRFVKPYARAGSMPSFSGQTPLASVAGGMPPTITLTLIAILAVALPALFYLELFLNPLVANLKQYAGERIGFGVFNGAPAFLLHATFYGASPFIVGVLLLAGCVLARSLPSRVWPALLLLALPFIWPDFLAIGAWNLSLVIFAAVLALVLRAAPRQAQPVALLWLWHFSYFIFYAFLIKSAGLHFYAMMPPLMLVVSQALPLDVSRARAWLRPVALTLFALLLVAAYAYDAVAYLREDPEYALDYPRTSLPFFPTMYAERPRDFFFGFPYRYGWSVIGALYRQGVLRGKFLSNETYLVTDWYVRDIGAAQDDEPRYYLRANDAPRGGDVPADLAERFHPWGEVRVHGRPKIQIYITNQDVIAAPQVFDAEQFPAGDPVLLARSLVYRQARGDDHAFRDLGRFLDKNIGDRDLLVLDTPLQDAIVPYYYRGAARMLTSIADLSSANALTSAPVIYASLFSAGETERWLAQRAFPVESHWFGSVRLMTYAPPLRDVPATAGGMRFGDAISLNTYVIAPPAPTTASVLRVALHWQSSRPLTTRYKVFVHILDAQGKVVAQSDAEPMADLAPTTSWQVGQTIDDLHGIRLPASLASQSLRVAVGLYDPDTNVRLAALAPDDHRYAGDAAELGAVTVP
jgi:hypothetical protein